MDELERADHAYQLERAGILSSAVGMARLALRDGDAEKARALLDEASIKCSTLLGDALLAGREQPLDDRDAARDPRDGYTADEMNAMVRGETTPAELCANPPAATKPKKVCDEASARALEASAKLMQAFDGATAPASYSAEWRTVAGRLSMRRPDAPAATDPRTLAVALERIEDALELCSWVSSTKAEIALALEGRLGRDHPIRVNRRELIERG